MNQNNDLPITEILDKIFDYLYRERKEDKQLFFILQSFGVQLTDDLQGELEICLRGNSWIADFQSNNTDCWFRISPQGILMMQKYGSYTKYVKAERREMKREKWYKDMQLKLDVISKPILLIISIATFCLAIYSLNQSNKNEKRQENMQRQIDSLSVKKN